MSVKKISFAGRTIAVGDRFRVTNSESGESELGITGSIIEILRIKDDEGEDSTVGIKSDTKNGRFHNLDGMTREGYGYWVRGYHIIKSAVPLRDDLTVSSDFNFRRRNLKGMRCRALSSPISDQILVEVEADVGAGSGDGLGKRGRCLFIPKSKLKETKKE